MSSKNGVDNRYWLRRSDMMYYKYIDILVKAFAYEAKNIIDVGTANTKYIESFYWISEKFSLDIKNPYKSPNVTAIEADFLNYTPKNKYDFATCFQVLEHIPDVDSFAKKLFEISDRVLISVPYLWPENAEDEHVNDPVSIEKLNKWTGREPSYSIIVSEPLRSPGKGISQRLMCYYGPEGEYINYKKAHENVKELSNNEIGSEVELEKLLREVEKNTQNHKVIRDDLKKIMEEQKKHNETVETQLDIYYLENELKHKMEINKEIESKIKGLKKDISYYNSSVQKTEEEQKYYLKEYDKILQSTSWKSTAPMRIAGSFLKKITRKNHT